MLNVVPLGIPYVPFPTIELGPVTLQVFGLCVAVGILLGGWVAARRNAVLGIAVEDTERIVIGLVVAGIIGARLLWIFANLDRIDSPLDLVAVWDGGLQFSGGFVLALLVSPYLVRGLSTAQRWHMIDGAAIGLAIGLMFGRIGCYAVGEHFGGETDFPLGVTYLGGDTIEGPLVEGQTYWSTPVLEFLYVGLVLAVLLWADRRRAYGAGTLAGIFCVLYAVSRFSSDFLRAYDPTYYGFTGAQYMTMLLLPVGIWFLVSARRRESPAVYQARLQAEAVSGAEAAAVAEREVTDPAGEPAADPASGPGSGATAGQPRRDISPTTD